MPSEASQTEEDEHVVCLRGALGGGAGGGERPPMRREAATRSLCSAGRAFLCRLGRPGLRAGAGVAPSSAPVTRTEEETPLHLRSGGRAAVSRSVGKETGRRGPGSRLLSPNV